MRPRAHPTRVHTYQTCWWGRATSWRRGLSQVGGVSVNPKSEVRQRRNQSHTQVVRKGAERQDGGEHQQEKAIVGSA